MQLKPTMQYRIIQWAFSNELNIFHTAMFLKQKSRYFTCYPLSSQQYKNHCSVILHFQETCQSLLSMSLLPQHLLLSLLHWIPGTCRWTPSTIENLRVQTKSWLCHCFCFIIIEQCFIVMITWSLFQISIIWGI